MKMLPAMIYCDTTGWYSEKVCDINNLVLAEFPEKIVKDYYKDRFGLPLSTFSKWYNEEYTADDTAGLYDYAKSRGYEWKPEIVLTPEDIKEEIDYIFENGDDGFYPGIGKLRDDEEWLQDIADTANAAMTFDLFEETCHDSVDAIHTAFGKYWATEREAI